MLAVALAGTDFIGAYNLQSMAAQLPELGLDANVHERPESERGVKLAHILARIEALDAGGHFAKAQRSLPEGAHTSEIAKKVSGQRQCKSDNRF